MQVRWLKTMLTVLAALATLTFCLWTPDLPREQLESKYLASATDMIDVGTWRLHVRDSGYPATRSHAPAVIMLHGFGSSLHTWDAWTRELSPDFRVIRVDLPGSGLSLPDPAHDYSDSRSLELLLALMGQLNIDRASVIGHSMGGRIAWTFAALHPQRVQKLVLIAPDGFASPGFDYGKPVEVPGTLSVMRYVLPKTLLRMNLQADYAQPDALGDALVDRYYDLIRAPGARLAMLERMQQTMLVEPLPLLRQIRAPTLLLWGQADGMIPVDNAKDFLQAIPGSRLVTLPNVGHLPQEEAAQASLQTLQAFLIVD
jgi:pimeloyl-ACP methyl ester carboxylesterase